MLTTHRTSRRLFCVVISYVLVVTTLTVMPAGAAKPSPTGAAKAKGTATSATARTAARQSAPKRVGELLVRFRDGVSEQVKDSVAAIKGARRKGKARGESGLEKLELPQGRDASDAAADLSRDPSVEMAEPNFLVSRDDVTPNDSRFSEQWALENVGQSGGDPGSDIHAAAAWRETTGSTSTVIAVIDGGIDFSHPDLKNNSWKNAGEIPDNGIDDDGDGLVDDVRGWNWVYNTNDVSDEQGHGTSVAGVIAAEGNNGAGVSGVMWRASLMSLKVLDSTGTEVG